MQQEKQCRSRTTSTAQLLDCLAKEVSENGKSATPYIFDANYDTMLAELMRKEAPVIILTVSEDTLQVRNAVWPLECFLDDLGFEKGGGKWNFEAILPSTCSPRSKILTTPMGGQCSSWSRLTGGSECLA